MTSAAIAAILQRAKAAAAPRVVERVALKRVRPVDGSCAPGCVFAEEDGWTFWRGDDRVDHVSRSNYLEPEPST